MTQTAPSHDDAPPPPAGRRLIEVAFPLEAASLDSVHEKNVRHGHISTLHIWPARRPLAACRAALIAALLPDPGNAAERRALLRRMAGRVVEKVKTQRRGGRTIERRTLATEGGILHWGRENGPDIDWFREKIREAYGGRAPKVLDPFAGGGAIPLEAMRLGCEATAADINPVAWFILKCTLDYPRRLAGKTLPLPDFAVRDRGFMEPFLRARGVKGRALADALRALASGGAVPALIAERTALEGGLADHVRAWGRRVLARARAKLAYRYPTYAEFQALAPGGEAFDKRPLALLPPDSAGATDAAPLNEEYSAEYTKDPRNPRWVAKPTVAYLWARTLRCKNCRADAPLLKTRWLARTDSKRVLLTMAPRADRSGVTFGIETEVPRADGNDAQRREHDRRLGAGTISGSGSQCPVCSTILTWDDIRLEGRAGRLGETMTAVVVDGPKGKEYRVPETEEHGAANVRNEELESLYAEIPYGLPEDPMAGEEALGFNVPLYGFDRWDKMFTARQFLALGVFLREARELSNETSHKDYDTEWTAAIAAYMALCLNRLADYSSAMCSWHNGRETMSHTFARFAFPMVWDYAEVNPLSAASGNFSGALDWVVRVLCRILEAEENVPKATVLCRSAIEHHDRKFDVICTDPPYYDAIPYSDLMDFFHIWLRRTTQNVSPEIDRVFSAPRGPKWTGDDGELIDEASRFGGDKRASRKNYEEGMARAFAACSDALNLDGRLVVVFANKHPNAWEALVAALIRAGFVVAASWPIQTEMQNRQRSLGSAALSSSVWLVCRKRAGAPQGWDEEVLARMRANIAQRLRDFWDAGIRGPDFVWAATGPGLEAFSKYAVVWKAGKEEKESMPVSEFLREVRRMVVDFVVGRVLTRDGDAEAASGLDDVTTYYLLHRRDYGLGAAPAGACILYALSCNLSDSDLASRHGILKRGSGRRADDDDNGDDGEGAAGGAGTAELAPWSARGRKAFGHEAPGGGPAPLIDRAHKAMQLWSAGDETRVNAYIDRAGLARNALFARVLQALIELAKDNERAVLEALSNHIAARAAAETPRQGAFTLS